MELEFELEDYIDLENREYGATLIIDAHLTREVEHGEAWGRPYRNETSVLEVEPNGTLFTYDQDGGTKRELVVDPLDYLTEDEIIGRLQND